MKAIMNNQEVSPDDFMPSDHDHGLNFVCGSCGNPLLWIRARGAEDGLKKPHRAFFKHAIRNSGCSEIKPKVKGGVFSSYDHPQEYPALPTTYVAWIQKKDIGENWKIKFQSPSGQEAFEHAAREANKKFGHLRARKGRMVPTRNLICIRLG